MTVPTHFNLRLIRRPDVCSRLGLPKSSLYEDIGNELMTPGVKQGLRRVAWPEHEVDAVLAAVIAGRPKAERQRLVRALIADRTRGVAIH